MTGTARRRPRVRGPRTAVLTGVLALSLLTACTHGTAAPEPTSDGDGEIVVASGLDVTGENGVRQQLIEEWNRTHDPDARLVELPGDADQQRSQLLGALQSGSDQYDVVNLDVTWVPEFAEAGLISVLDDEDLVTDDFVDAVRDTGTWRSHTYAVPFNSDVGLLYYRKDVLRDAGVRNVDPATWGRLYRMMNQVDQDEDRAVEDGGWTGQLDVYEGLTVSAVEALASVGVSLADKNDGHYSADPESLAEGLNELEDRVERATRRARTSREYTSLNDFAHGRATFLRHWPYAYQQLLRSLGPENLGVAPLPGTAVLGGQNLAVAAHSPRAQSAVELIRFLTKDTSQACLLDAGLPAVLTSVYHGEARCRLGQSAPAEEDEDADTTVDADEHRIDNGTLLRALQQAESRPRTPYYGAFTQALQNGVSRWLDETDRRRKRDIAAALDEDLREALAGR